MRFDVYGVGNALVDLQAQVADALVDAVGFNKGIMTLVDDAQQQAVLERIASLPLNRCAGGSAANTVVGVADFGGAAAYCGKVANDSWGEFFLKDMRDLGVTIDVTPAESGQTGTCARSTPASARSRSPAVSTRVPRATPQRSQTASAPPARPSEIASPQRSPRGSSYS